MTITRRQIIEQIENGEEQIKSAFLDMIYTLRGSVAINDVIDAIERNDVNALIDLYEIEEPALLEFNEEIRSQFLESGKNTFEDIKNSLQRFGVRTVLRFDIRNTNAERWLSDNSSSFVRQINTSQRMSIMMTLTESLELGDNPRTTARKIAGRINPATGRREGGIIGLTDKQTEFIINARRELESGDTTLYSKFLRRTLRDKRFDRKIQSAIDSNETLSRVDINNIINRYSDRLLNKRATDIARTESLRSFGEGENQSLMQAIDAGLIDSEFVAGVWLTASDGRVRGNHNAINRQQMPLNEPFVTPSGARLRYPGDTSLGAPAEEVVNCRCIKQTKIDYIAQAKSRN